MKYKNGKSPHYTKQRSRNFHVRLWGIVALFSIVLSACAGGTAASTPRTDVEDSATPQPPATATPVRPTTEPEAPVVLEGTYWTLASYIDADGNTLDILPDTTVDAKFTADQISGSAGCNQYFGSYTHEGNRLIFDAIGVTEMFCQLQPLMDQEMAYLAALTDVTAYDVVGGRLHLSNADGTTVLTFIKVEGTEDVTPVTLDGTHWTLVGFGDTTGSISSSLNGTSIDAEFTADQIGGSGGCNRYFGAYETDGNNITLGPIGATRIACGEAVGKQEARYFAALESIVAYQVVNGQLHLLDANGTTVLMFAKAEVVATPEWTVEMLKNTTYTIEGLGDVELVGGEYTYQYGDGATMVNQVGLLDTVLGDLDGDGADDAAAILWWDSGGSGMFFYIAAMRNVNGVPRQVGMLLLGERVQPGAFSIVDGQIVLEMMTHGPDDPMCCASQRVVETFALDGNMLKLLSSEAVKPELIGTVWLWDRLDTTDETDRIVVDDPARYTLELLEDGTYQIKADCNLGSGGYTRIDNTLTLNPGPMTLAACGPESLYDVYVENLGRAGSFTFDSTNLILELKDDAGTMVFVMK